MIRRFAISDVHGCCKTLKELVSNGIQLQKEDQLFFLGDYIDRGPDSKGVFDYIWELQDAGYQVRCLKGNHEDMLFKAFEGWRKDGVWRMNGGDTTLKSFAVGDVKKIPKLYLDFMEQLPLYIELEDYWLVHAGFNFLAPGGMFTDEEAMLWIRRWYKEINWETVGKRTIVHGHTPISQAHIEERIVLVKSLPLPLPINIDAGCVYQHTGLGKLCALNLDEKTVIFQNRID